MGWVGCYSIDLYCDDPNHSYLHTGTVSQPGTVTGETLAECKREARRCGWKLTDAVTDGGNGVGTAICGECWRRQKTKKRKG